MCKYLLLVLYCILNIIQFLTRAVIAQSV